MSGKSKARLKKKGPEIHHQPQMKLVTAETCIVCPTPCQRGLQYVAKMSQPGAVGRGVPCILTLK